MVVCSVCARESPVTRTGRFTCCPVLFSDVWKGELLRAPGTAGLSSILALHVQSVERGDSPWSWLECTWGQSWAQACVHRNTQWSRTRPPAGKPVMLVWMECLGQLVSGGELRRRFSGLSRWDLLENPPPSLSLF